MPVPRKDEKRSDFISRCISQVVKEGKEQDQAVAMCHQIWRDKDKKKASEKIIGRSIDLSDMLKFTTPQEIPTTMRIEILQTGIVDHPVFGKFRVTKKDLETMIRNFDNKIIPGVRITAGHEDTEHELPATGWFNTLEIIPVPDTKNKFALIGLIEWNSKGKEVLMEREFKYFSPEFAMNWIDPEQGTEHGPTLLGGAHTNQPFFKGLKPIVASTKLVNFLRKPKMVIEKKKVTKKVKASTKKKDVNTVTMSLKEHKALLDKAEINAAEAKDLKKMSARLVKLQTAVKFEASLKKATRLIFSEKRTKAVFVGKKGLKTKLAHFMTSLNKAQTESFVEIMKLAKTETQMFSELGVSGKKSVRSTVKEVHGYPVQEYSVKLDEKAKEIMASNKKMSYPDAMVEAEKELGKE